MEKCAILTHIFNRDFQLYLEYSPNELAEFMWHGQFKNEDFQ